MSRVSVYSVRKTNISINLRPPRARSSSEFKIHHAQSQYNCRILNVRLYLTFGKNFFFYVARLPV